MCNWIPGRRKEGQNGTKAVFEDMFLKLRIFSNLKGDISPQIQEAMQIASIINTKKKHRVLSG